MRKKTKRKIKRIAILAVLVVTVSLGFIIYITLGPLRSFFWNAPYLMGFLGPRNYLVLLQNNNELRPTGGFITAVAEVSTLFGFVSIEVFDSYQIPNPEPRIPAPDAFEYFIGQNDPFFAGWTLRDANFSPDFATSSKDIIDLYQAAYPDKEIDAVIAIDFSVIESLLEQYGPFTVEDVIFDKESFFIQSQRISKDVDTHDVDQLKNRKNILKPFANTLKNKIVRSPVHYKSFFENIDRLIKAKHILAYSTSASFQQKLEQFQLSNIITGEDSKSDYLHVNIANIGGRKADRYITKDIKYLADFSNPSDLRSKLEIRLEHLGSYNIQSDIYQAYIRTYVPLNAELISSGGETLRKTESFIDLGLTVFADYIRMRPGDVVTLTYNYKLPNTIYPEDYRIRVVKQPGTQNQWWQVAVKQMNDSSMENVPDFNNETTEMIIRENLAIWRGVPEQDLNFHIFKKIDNRGPVILWQKFTDLQTINIRFQELIDKDKALDPANYKIMDLNKNNQTTDNITVSKVEFEERDLWITVDGVTDQAEEHYQITIRDIQDLYGNIIVPNPIIRTLVQRIEDEE